MRVIFRFKGKSPRHADTIIESGELGTLNLEQLSKLWDAEHVINEIPGVRLHLEVKE